MIHSYFLDTVEAIRTCGHTFFDIFLIISIYMFVVAGLHILSDKGVIDNIHSSWVLGGDTLV